MEARSRCKLVASGTETTKRMSSYLKKMTKGKHNSLYALQKILRMNLTSSNLLSFNDLKTENIQLASDLLLAEETIQKQNEEFVVASATFHFKGTMQHSIN